MDEKYVYILDMLFLDKHGYITRIVRNTSPFLNIIPSMGNVLGVLELLGGKLHD